MKKIEASLINYSEYSERMGFLRIKEIVDYAVTNGQNYASLTDVGTLFGMIDFIKECELNKINPIIGVTFNIQSDDYFDKNRDKNSEITKGTITLIAKNKNGYENLNKLIGKQDKNNLLRIPTLEAKNLNGLTEDLICITGSRSSLIGTMILNNEPEDKLNKTASFFKNIFKDDFYLEALPLSERSLDKTNEIIITKINEISKNNKIEQVATFNSRFKSYSDYNLLLEKINASLAERNRHLKDSLVKKISKTDFFIPTVNLESLFEERDYSIENIEKIINKIEKYKVDRELEFPETYWSKESEFDSLIEFRKNDFFNSKYFYGLVNHTLKQNYEEEYIKKQNNINNDNSLNEIEKKNLIQKERNNLKEIKNKIEEELKEKYTNRIIEELNVIKNCNGNDFTKYFTTLNGFKIVTDEIDESFAVRGSALSSIVVYLIIEGYKSESMSVDPVFNNLLFQRFLNPQRAKYPDIDMDFGNKEKVITAFNKKFMKDRKSNDIGMAYIVAGGSDLQKIDNLFDKVKKAILESDFLKSRFIKAGAIKGNNADFEIQKKYEILINKYNGLGYILKESEKLTKLINSNKKYKEFVNKDKFNELFLRLAFKLQGQTSTINKGQAQRIVISNNNLLDGTLPVTKVFTDEKSESSIDGLDLEYEIQVPANYIEKHMGLIKYDVLPAVAIGNIENALKDIKRKTGLECDTSGYSLTYDNDVMKLFEKGLVIGAFQLSTANGQRLVNKYKPKNFDDIVNISSLLRPGPNKHEDNFLKSRENISQLDIIHPELNSTYGIIIFEEQIINLAQSVGKFSAGEADVLRVMISKKTNLDKIYEMKSKFINNAKSHALDNNEDPVLAVNYATKVFEFIEDMSGYTFNKGHAIRYAMTAYQQMWLKLNFPAEFINYLDIPETTPLTQKEKENKRKERYNPFKVYLDFELKEMNVKINNLDINKIEKLFKTETNLDGEKSIHFGLESLLKDKKIAQYIIDNRPKEGFRNKVDFIYRIVDGIKQQSEKPILDIKKLKELLPIILGESKIPEGREYLSDLYKSNALSNLEPINMKNSQIMELLEEAILKLGINSSVTNNFVNNKYKSNSKQKTTTDNPINYTKKVNNNENYDIDDNDKKPWNCNSLFDHSHLYKEKIVNLNDVILYNEILPAQLLISLDKVGLLKIKELNNKFGKVMSIKNQEFNQKIGFHSKTSPYNFNFFSQNTNLSGALNLILTLNYTRIIELKSNDSKTALDFIKDVYDNPESGLKVAVAENKELEEKYGVGFNSDNKLSYPSQIPYLYKDNLKNKKIYEEMMYVYLSEKRFFNRNTITKLYKEGKVGIGRTKSQGKTMRDDFGDNKQLIFLMTDENKKFNFGQTVTLHLDLDQKYQEKSKLKDDKVFKPKQSKMNFSGRAETNLFRISNDDSKPVTEITFSESIYDTISRFELNQYLGKNNQANFGVTGVNGVLQWFKSELGLDVEPIGKKVNLVNVNNLNSKVIYLETKKELIDVTDSHIQQFLQKNTISLKDIESLKDNQVKKSTIVPDIGEQRDIYFRLNKNNFFHNEVESFNKLFNGKFNIKTFDDFTFNPKGKQAFCVVLDETNVEKFFNSNNFSFVKNNNLTEVKIIKKITEKHYINDEIRKIIKNKLFKYFGNNEIRMGKEFDQDKAGCELLPTFDLICATVGIVNTSKIAPKGAPKDLNDVLKEFKKREKEEGFDSAMRYLIAYENKSIPINGISSNPEILQNLINIFPDCFLSNENDDKLSNINNIEDKTLVNLKPPIYK